MDDQEEGDDQTNHYSSFDVPNDGEEEGQGQQCQIDPGAHP